MSPSADYHIENLPDGAVLRWTRPAKLNALTKPMLLALSALLDDLETRGARVLVIVGEGDKAFCAGTDLAETQVMPKPERLDKSEMARRLFARLSRSKVVSVAAMNGLAFGGGLELAMACTLRLAKPHVTVSLPEIKLGLLPAYGGTQFLAALVGKSRALEIMLTGRVVQLAEALAMGLVHRPCPADADLVAQALLFAREVTRFSQPAINGIRECVEAAGPDVSDEGLAVEDAVVRRVFASDDAQEGVAAFLEKRPPNFQNR